MQSHSTSAVKNQIFKESERSLTAHLLFKNFRDNNDWFFDFHLEKYSSKYRLDLNNVTLHCVEYRCKAVHTVTSYAEKVISESRQIDH